MVSKPGAISTSNRIYHLLYSLHIYLSAYFVPGPGDTKINTLLWSLSTLLPMNPSLTPQVTSHLKSKVMSAGQCGSVG